MMAKKSNSPVKHDGMGAIVAADGVTFRVWAPNAEKVYLTGMFNDWSETASPMDKEENGHWAIAVSDASVGDEYRYLIHSPVGTLSRLDPYARKVTNSVGNSVIYDQKDFDWGNDHFTIAPRNELVMYEMHIGTFNVKKEGCPGTLDSACERLPYLQKLGIGQQSGRRSRRCGACDKRHGHRSINKGAQYGIKYLGVMDRISVYRCSDRVVGWSYHPRSRVRTCR
jgi:1,4-alpha-glucan branching enzyme